MSLEESCRKGDLEGVKASLQRGNDVNTKYEDGWTGLTWAVYNNHNSVVELLLKTPTIDVNQKDDAGECALYWAVAEHNNEVVTLLLNVPTIDVNIVNSRGHSLLHRAVIGGNVKGLKLLLSHPSLTAVTLNQKDKYIGATPLMWAARDGRLKPLAVLAADPRVDLYTIDKEGRSLEEWTRWGFLVRFNLSVNDLNQYLRDPKSVKIVGEAWQRWEKRRQGI